MRIDDLVKKALLSDEGKYRLCLHPDDQNMLHESIIVTTKNDHSHFIHKHMETSEFNMIIRGKLLIVLFDEVGNISQAFVLEAGKKLLFRINSNQYHLAVPLTDIVVFLETKQGPFRKEKNILPIWACGGTDTKVSIQKAMEMINDLAWEEKHDFLQHTMH